MTISTDLIILAYGQSNEQAQMGSIPTPETITAGDQDASGTIVEYHSGGSEIPAVQPFVWPAQNSNLGPTRSFKMAQELISQMGSGKKIVIIPGAVGGQALYNGALAAPSGAYYVPDKAELTAALAEYPGARVIMSFTQGEQDSNDAVSEANYIAAFNSMVNGFRSVSGAENMEVILHQMVPERFLVPPAEIPNRVIIDLAHKKIPLQKTKCWFIASNLGYQRSGDPAHFTAAGQRIAGTRAAAQIDFANTLSAAAPNPVSNIAVITGAVTFTAPVGSASAYNVQLRNAGSSDAWVDNIHYPNFFVAPGDTVSVPLTTTGKEARVIAKSFGGDSAAVGSTITGMALGLQFRI